MGDEAAIGKFLEGLDKLMGMQDGSEFTVGNMQAHIQYMYDKSRNVVYAMAAGNKKLSEKRQLTEAGLKMLADMGYVLNDTGYHVKAFSMASADARTGIGNEFVRVFTEVYKTTVAGGIAYTLALGPGGSSVLDQLANVAGKVAGAALSKPHTPMDRLNPVMRGYRQKGCMLVLAAIGLAGLGSYGLLDLIFG